MHQFQPLSAKSSLRLLLLIILTYGAGFLTSFWTSNPASINWYHALYQAPGTPPAVSYTHLTLPTREAV